MYLRKEGKGSGGEREKDVLRKLLVRQDVEDSWRFFSRKRFLTAALGTAAAAAVILAAVAAELSDNRKIQSLNRPLYPWQQQIYELEAGLGGEMQKVTISVRGKELTPQQLDACFEEAEELFWQQMLGENADFSYVTKDLNFSSEAQGTTLTAVFRPQEFSAIGADGRLIRAALDRVGYEVTVYLELQAGEKSRVFQRQVTLYGEEKEEEQLERFLALAEGVDRQEAQLLLPESFQGKELTFQLEKESSWPLLVLCLPVVPVLLWQLPGQRQKEQLKRREEQLLRSYSELILKFSLFLQAGLTLRSAWQKIAEDHRKEHQGKKEFCYAYEEMWLSLCRMRSGVSEREEYRNFGARIGLHPYLRLSGLLEQNLEKGNRSLLSFFQREQIEAFEERKNRIRKLGEEAGTKLLGPMMLYFLIVLVILLVPAWLSLS